jgi:plastocyanin
VSLVLTSRAATNTVNMNNFSFSPVTANISLGDTVRWLNNSGTLHDSRRHPLP